MQSCNRELITLSLESPIWFGAQWLDSNVYQEHPSIHMSLQDAFSRYTIYWEASLASLLALVI